MRDFVHHATDDRRIFMLDRLVQLAQPQRLDGALLPLGISDGALGICYPNLCHIFCSTRARQLASHPLAVLSARPRENDASDLASWRPGDLATRAATATGAIAASTGTATTGTAA